MDLAIEKVLTWFQNRRSKFRKESKNGHIMWMRQQLFTGDGEQKLPAGSNRCATLPTTQPEPNLPALPATTMATNTSPNNSFHVLSTSRTTTPPSDEYATSAASQMMMYPKLHQFIQPLSEVPLSGNMFHQSEPVTQSQPQIPMTTQPISTGYGTSSMTQSTWTGPSTSTTYNYADVTCDLPLPTLSTYGPSVHYNQMQNIFDSTMYQPYPSATYNYRSSYDTFQDLPSDSLNLN